jgi:hypothetical protein
MKGDTPPLLECKSGVVGGMSPITGEVVEGGSRTVAERNDSTTL